MELTIYANEIILNQSGNDMANALGAPNNSWSTDSGAASWSCRFGYPDLPYSLTSGATHTVNVTARKSLDGGGNPTWQIELWDDGTLVGQLANGTLSTLNGTLSATFTTSQLSNVNNLEIRVGSTYAGGALQERALQVDAVGVDLVLDPLENINIVNPFYFSLAKDRIVDGVWDSLWLPRVEAAKNPVIYMHGAGASDDMARQANDPAANEGQRRVLTKLATNGYNVACISAPNTWGNSTLVSRVDAAIDYLKQEHGSVGPAVIIGASHGGACAYNYVYARPMTVACIVGILPAVDVDDIRDNDRWGLRADIDAAWGVTYPDPLPAGACPSNHTSSFVNTPSQLWYAEDDSVINAASVTAFATAIGATAYNVGAMDHSNYSTMAVDIDDVYTFIVNNT